MSKQNVIASSENRLCTKKDILELIEKTFVDDEVGTHGSIAAITTVTMTDGTVSQTVTFGKIFK